MGSVDVIGVASSWPPPCMLSFTTQLSMVHGGLGDRREGPLADNRAGLGSRHVHPPFVDMGGRRVCSPKTPDGYEDTDTRRSGPTHSVCLCGRTRASGRRSAGTTPQILWHSIVGMWRFLARARARRQALQISLHGQRRGSHGRAACWSSWRPTPPRRSAVTSRRCFVNISVPAPSKAPRSCQHRLSNSAELRKSLGGAGPNLPRLSAGCRLCGPFMAGAGQRDLGPRQGA